MIISHASHQVHQSEDDAGVREDYEVARAHEKDRIFRPKRLQPESEGDEAARIQLIEEVKRVNPYNRSSQAQDQSEIEVDLSPAASLQRQRESPRSVIARIRQQELQIKHAKLEALNLIQNAREQQQDSDYVGASDR